MNEHIDRNDPSNQLEKDSLSLEKSDENCYVRIIL